MRNLNSLANESVWPKTRVSLFPMGHLLSNFEDVVENSLPRSSFREAEECFFVTFDMPGIKKEDITIETVDGILRVTGIRKDLLKFGSTSSEQTERTYAHSVVLPKSGDLSGMRAVLEDGVLTVVVPKSELAKPRKVEIESDTGGLQKLLSAFKK